VATTAENISGNGEVFIKETGEIVGRFPFRLRTYQRPGRVIWSMDLVVGLDVDSAIPLLNQNARLVLRVADRRCVDFQIASVSRLPDRVEVVASGGLREAEE
jgi:hypothetical protein